MTPRSWANRPDNDNTGRNLDLFQAEPAYAATLALTPNASISYYKVGQLTGAMTINLTTSSAKDLDEIVILLEADATNRIVTFGTGFVSSGTLTVTGTKKGTVRAIYDGAAFRVYSREVSA